jgi:uncharacterized protein
MSGWPLDLLDWKRRVNEMYRLARLAEGSLDGLIAFRATKDALFRDHPQSPLTPEARETFAGLPYFDHRPELRVECAIEAVPDDESADIALPVLSGDVVRARRIGHVHPTIDAASVRLAIYWLDGYGGGLFIPFRDATAGSETYGAGRYLLDTVKGADLGTRADGTRVVIDFNYAYNPSCAYDPTWVCPLAPFENRLDVPIYAGERAPETHG